MIPSPCKKTNVFVSGGEGGRKEEKERRLTKKGGEGRGGSEIRGKDEGKAQRETGGIWIESWD